MGSIRLGLCVCLCLAAPALAQESRGNNAPPAEKLAVSPGGVDMRSGRYAYDQTDLTIGGGALSLARSLAQPVAGHVNPFANFSHNWDVLISEKRINIFQNNFVHQAGQSDYQMEVSFGGVSQTFRSYGSPTYGFDQISRAGFGSLTFTGTKASNAVYTFTGGDGAQAVFRAINSADCSTILRCAYVSQLTQPDGTRLDFVYDNQGAANTTRLRAVTSSRGYALLLEYSGALVTKACVLNLAVTPKPANNVCPAGAQATVTYGYASVGGASRLASASDPTGAVWGFTYSGAPPNVTMGYVRPGDVSPWLTNTIWERADSDGLIQEIVAQQSFADGSSYDYAYEFTPTVYCQNPQVIESLAGGSYTDNLGQTTTLRYDFPFIPFSPSQGHGDVGACDGNDPPSLYVHQVTPGPIEITDPLGRVTRFDYCDPGPMANLPPNWWNRCYVMPMPVSVTSPEGIKTELLTDFVARNVLRRTQIAKPGTTQPNGQPWPNIVTQATFYCAPATARYCNKPLTETDARGAVTDRTYSADHGGLLTETLPAPAAGAPRPQTRNTYAQRYAWISNGAGGYVQSATPVWLPVATSTCRTSAATGNPASPCATAGDEVLTQYDFGPDSGPNNLLLRGQTVTSTEGGVPTTLRTCYTYDALGRKISETQPNANPGSCP